MNFPLIYSLVFGGITAIIWGTVDLFDFIPEIALTITFGVWIGGLAVYYIMEWYDIEFITTVQTKCDPS
jgi:hypothetical protein